VNDEDLHKIGRLLTEELGSSGVRWKVSVDDEDADYLEYGLDIWVFEGPTLVVSFEVVLWELDGEDVFSVLIGDDRRGKDERDHRNWTDAARDILDRIKGLGPYEARPGSS
jgi:hypothetical protein